MPTSNLLAIFIFSFWISMTAVVSPGPVSAAIISEAPRQGWRTGPLIAIGHTILELLMVLLIGLGLSYAMATHGARIVIAIVGGLVLIVMGASMVHGAATGTLRLSTTKTRSPNPTTLSLILLGVITTVSNPFWYTWWVTVAAGYLAQAKALSTVAVGAFYLGHISADFAWDTTLATASSAGSAWLTDNRYRTLIAITGGFMLFLGITYIHSALAG